MQERNINQLPLMHAPPRNQTHNPGMCPDWELNQQPFGLQAGAHSTEPQQPGLFFSFKTDIYSFPNIWIREIFKKIKLIHNLIFKDTLA